MLIDKVFYQTHYIAMNRKEDLPVIVDYFLLAVINAQEDT
jgi:hypothetical protein